MSRLEERLKELEIGKAEVTWNGRGYSYRIISRKLAADPKYFVSYGNGNPFISDEVPEKFRPYMILHELMEFQSQKRKVECINALKGELAEVPFDKLAHYLEFRVSTFRYLRDYLNAQDNPGSFLDEVQKSLAYLEQLIREEELKKIKSRKNPKK